MSKYFIFFVLWCSVTARVSAQIDTIYTSIEHDLEYFDPSHQNYIPFFKQTGTSTNAISFTIKKEYLNNQWIVITSEQSSSIFLEGKIIHHFQSDTVLFIQLSETMLGKRYSIYSNNNIEGIGVQLAKSASVSAITSLKIQPKKNLYFLNLIVVVLLIILGLFAYIRGAGSEVTSGHFKWIRALSPRTISEALYKTRMLEKGNIQIIIALSLLVGASILSSFHLLGFSSVIGSLFKFTEFLTGFIYWVLISLIVFVGFGIKNLLINGFASLYRFSNIARVHFFNYIRLSSLIFSIFLASICTNIFIFDSDWLVSFSHIILLSLLVIRVLVLFIKLLNFGTHRILHLFSYICATELIPYIVIVKITFL